MGFRLMINQEPTVKSVVRKRSLALNHCSTATEDHKGRQSVVNSVLGNLKTLIKINQNELNCEWKDIPMFPCDFAFHPHNQENQNHVHLHSYSAASA